MSIPSKEKVFTTLVQLIGTTIYTTRPKNKGWKGLKIEQLVGFKNNNSRLPDGINYELKTFPLHKNKKQAWVPKETMSITMLSTTEIIKSFKNTGLFLKIKDMIMCGLSHDGTHADSSTILTVKNVIIKNQPGLISDLEQDYQDIQNQFFKDGIKHTCSKKYLQIRTKGAGKGSTSQAFYFNKNFIKQHCM